MNSKYWVPIFVILGCTHLNRPAPESPDIIESPDCPNCPVCPVCPDPQVLYRERIRVQPVCKTLGMPPEIPKVDWAPPNCPIRQFGACLSIEDSITIIKYLKAQATFNNNVKYCNGQ